MDPPLSLPDDLAPSASAGTPLELAPAHHVVPLVRARGAMFLVTTREGDVTPAGARELGLFHADTRYLSHWKLRVGDLDMVYLSDEVGSGTINQIDLMLAGIEAQEFLDDPSHFVHIRRRQLLDDDAFVEQLVFTNYLHKKLVFEVGLGFAADFADIFEVRGARRPRRGTLRAPEVFADRALIAYDGLDGRRYTTRVSFSPPPTVLLGHEARFMVELAPGERVSIEASVRPEAGAARAPQRVPFFQRHARLEEEAHAFERSCTEFRCDVSSLEQALSRARSDMFAMRMRVDEHAVMGAGIPWFCCPFGRDSLLASYEALTLSPALAGETLRTLAAYQGTKDDPFTEEEPGKILHELRFGEMARTGETPHRPYYGSVDATPLFVVVLDATFEATADLPLVRELAPALRAALGWIDRKTANGSKLATYEKTTPLGLDNQAWKDSRAAVVTPSGVRALPPIAIAEVQGYCLDAYARGARLLALLGDEEGAARARERAQRFGALVEEQLWLEREQRYAYAVDGTGARIPTVVSNLGHLLWSRAASPERARQTADLLVSPPSFSGFGVRTLSAAHAAFNPLSYHNGTVWPHDNAIIARGLSFYGLFAHVATIAEGIFAALEAMTDRRLPELFCGMDRGGGGLVRYPVACSPQAWAAAAPFLLLQSVLGMTLDAPDRRLHIREPRLPPPLTELRIERMQVGDSRVSLCFLQRDRRCDVDVLDVEGGELRTLIEL